MYTLTLLVFTGELWPVALGLIFECFFLSRASLCVMWLAFWLFYVLLGCQCHCNQLPGKKDLSPK